MTEQDFGWVHDIAASAADDTVRDAIWALMGANRCTVRDLSRVTGINHETLRRKLKGEGEKQALTVGEAARIAVAFDVQIGSLFDGLGGHVKRAADSRRLSLRERAAAAPATNSTRRYILVDSLTGRLTKPATCTFAQEAA